MKNKKNILYGLAIVIIGIIYSPVHAQQKDGIHRTKFSGEWKSKESIAWGGNIVCSYNPGDRMLAKTMKIAEQANFLTVSVSSSFPGEAPVTGQEKLTFDGKASEIDHDPGNGKKFSVKLSADGRTMTVNTIVHLKAATPYLVNVQQQAFVYVTEVWKLSNDGQSISIQAKQNQPYLAKSVPGKLYLIKLINIRAHRVTISFNHPKVI